ncbi:recombination regulator RecX [Streptococcus dysgalactiae]|uniref:Regulatory protein RecX n=1 Tax=Streptococcus dysgalactiae subsp. equisimilis TaxID=119602 RepID=A0A9X8XG41_STREQ|nr:recombination regulator RecX [Streptococcus dysgalactiae]MDO5365659.1 recombination regulator RecX [Streptococcus dysgalactiae]SQF67481.1 recombination regulator [Streptococcus dysgalactiae subsp. equisimilis]VEF05941.1 recombination regulator [Streptococcus dysgalactiae subsp. equisimilis]
MKITKIEKKKRLYLVEFDDNDALYVTEDTIVHFMLSKDKVLDNDQLEDIKHFAQLSYGKNLALYFLSFQQRSQKQVKDYLLKHDIDESIIPDIIHHLQQDKWLDDAKLAETYIRQNQLNGDKGPQVLKQKLLQKGIASHDIDPILSQTDFNQVAQKVSQKLFSKYQEKLPPKALKDKLMQSLLTKGFSYDLAKHSLNQLNFDQDNQEIEDLLDKELDKQYRKLSRKYDGYTLKQKLYQTLYRKGYPSDDITSKLRDYL